MKPKNKNCHWLRRWLHRRARRIDTQIMATLVYANVQRWLKQHPESTKSPVELFNAAWGSFINQRGQEHWHCACAHRDWERTHGEPYPW